MPGKELTPKQEAFCLAYLETGNASEAYRRAGYSPGMADKTVNEAASRLLRASKVLARLEELRRPAVKAAQITLESHLTRLEELSKAAQASAQFGAAITAEIARGKASGVHVERSEISGPNGGPIQSEATLNMSPTDLYSHMLKAGALPPTK